MSWKVIIAMVWLVLLAVGVMAGGIWVILEEPWAMVVMAGIAVVVIGTVMAVCALDDQHERRKR